jgi:hypothetical protein
MQNAVLFFMCGELYWEFARFVPHFIWKRTHQYKKRKDVDFIVMTKPENFDMYGKYASVLVPFKLKDDGKYKPNCFRLDGISQPQYKQIIDVFKSQFQDRYKILETITPDISKHQYVNKNQFPKNKMDYTYQPRSGNKDVIEKYMNGKPVVILGPRYRTGYKRNWPYWNELYDLIWENEILRNKYNFIICGKDPDYIPDQKFRFMDINKFEQNINSSLIGITMECMKKAVLTVGSQSAIPNISLMYNVPAIMWGHQKQLHTVTYNIRRTKVTFLEDMKYDIQPETIYTEITKLLK